MIEPADFTQDTAEEGGLILRLNGAWTIAGVADADKRLRALGDAVRHIDLSAVEHIDTVGAWIVYRTARDMGADIVGVNANARSLIEAVGGVDSNDSIAPPVISPIIKLIGELGDAVLTAFGRWCNLLPLWVSV
jgi:phospholipid/cholesterol/gamma-HCH transport system permease protein